MGPPTSEATAAAPASQALSWSDEGKAVVVRVPLPSSSADAEDDVVVDAGGGGLVVSLASSKTELLRILQLYGTIDASKVSKSVSRGTGKDESGSGGGEVVVTLPKLDDESSSERWPSLEARADEEGGDGSSSPSGAAAALAEREHVARLLNAAKEGDFDELKAAAEKYRGDVAAGDGDDATKQSSSGVGAIKDGNGRSVLHFAVAGKNTACAEWLVDECGVDVNAMDDSSACFLFPNSTKKRRRRRRQATFLPSLLSSRSPPPPPPFSPSPNTHQQTRPRSPSPRPWETPRPSACSSTAAQTRP